MTKNNISQNKRLRFFIKLLVFFVLFIVLHEGILKLSDVSSIKALVQPIFTYYPVSVRPIFPKPNHVRGESLNLSSSIPKVHLTTSNYGMYSFFNGISALGINFLMPNEFSRAWWNWNANYHQRGKKWERPANLKVQDSKGRFLLDENLGIRINGNTSRAFPQKSFRLCFRNKYGIEQMSSPFNNDEKSEYRTLVLRNLGANWGNLYSIDAIIQESIPRKDIIIRAVPVQLLLNDQDWGVYYLRNKIELSVDEQRQGTKLIKPSTSEYKKLIDNLYVLVSEMDDSLFYSMANRQLDLESFSYMIFIHTLFGNKDWPRGNMAVKLSAERKAKFYIKDLDLAFTLELSKGGFKDLYATNSNVFFELFLKLMRNRQFRNQYMSMVESYFVEDCFENQLDQYRKRLSPKTEIQANRWGRYSIKEIDTYLFSVRDSFEFRKSKYIDYLEQYN